MKKYVIRTGTGDSFNAASKARQDADAIAVSLGYVPFEFQGKRTADGSISDSLRLIWASWKNWRKLIHIAEPGSIILVQYPHMPLKSAFLIRNIIPRAQMKKKLCFVALIHDLNSARGLFGKTALYSDRKILPLFDRIICHNEKMKDHLVIQGIPKQKLIPLGIFDYLTDAPEILPRKEDGIIIAGNLDTEKSGYVRRLIQSCKLHIHLYGKGLESKTLPENVFYHGVYSPEELPGMLKGGFGLVWDGPEITSCKGQSGSYLQINDPHKFSLYLSAGLPVIIWDKAALSDFVEECRIGIKIDNLENIVSTIQSITDEKYQSLCKNASNIKIAIRNGEKLKMVLIRIEEAL